MWVMADNSDLGHKILVAGQGGKSTLARAIAVDRGLPYIEMDALTYEPNWVAVPADEFRVRVRAAMDDHPDGWVIDGNQAGSLRGMVAKEAETVVFVNIPFARMMWRIFRRSVARARDKRLICGENTESWGRILFSRDSLLWFLLRHRKSIGRRSDRFREWTGEDAQFIELAGAGALDRFYEERGLVRE